MTTFGFLSLLPVGVALLVMVISRRVALSLLMGAGVGWMQILFFGSDLRQPITKERLAVMMFVVFMSFLSALLQSANAFHAFYMFLQKRMTSRRKAQLSYAMSVLPAIVDEQNANLRAPSSLCARFLSLKLSREKLALLTDQFLSIAPSITGLSIFCAFVATLLEPARAAVNFDMDGVHLMLASIPYNFYAWFSLMSVTCTLLLNRDLGFMHEAEKKAHEKTINNAEEHVRPATDTSPQILLFGSLAALILGFSLSLAGMPDNLGAASSMAFLVGASLAIFFSVFFSLANHLIVPEQLLHSAIKGGKDAVPLLLILITAWVYADAIAALSTARFLFDGLFVAINPVLLPVLMFAIAAMTAHIMDSSFGVFALLTPILPIIFMMSADHTITAASIAALVGGTIFGGHICELFDTTAQAAIGARVDIAHHLRSSLPYNLFAASLAIGASIFCTAWSEGYWWILAMGGAFIVMAVFACGRPIKNHSTRQALWLRHKTAKLSRE